MANVLTSFPEHRRLFVKVTTNSLTTTRRTVLQYRGPDVSDVDVNVPDLALHLPYYRRKNHLFTKGKENLGISERPVKIPRTTTVRLKLDDQGLPYLATDKINVNLDMIAAASIQVSISKQLSTSSILYLWSHASKLLISQGALPKYFLVI